METCPFPRLGQSLCLGRGKPEEGERKQGADPRWLFRQAAAFRLSDDLWKACGLIRTRGHLSTHLWAGGNFKWGNTHKMLIKSVPGTGAAQ